MSNITITPLSNNVTITEESKNITFTDQTTDITFAPQSSKVEFTVPVYPTITFNTSGIVYNTISSFNDAFRGNWVSNTVYNVGDLVNYNEVLYVCSATITSASNPTQLPNNWREVVNTNTGIEVVDAGGDGSLTIDANGVLTYTGPNAAEIRAHFSAGTGITINNGQIATTITQYTDTLARQAVGALDNGGDGSFTYNSTTGVFTYTGPNASQVRAHFSAGSGISLVDGQISVDGTIATKSYADTAATNAVNAVIDGAPAALDTLNELAAALNDDANYASTITTALGTKLNTADFTSTANSWLQTKSTTDIAEGNKLFYTTARANTDFDARLQTKTTTDLAEGTNQYYTDTRARNAISVVDNNGDGSFSYNPTTGVITYTGPSANEVRAHFSAGTGITLVNGQISTTITQYTDSDVRNAVSAVDAGGDGSFSYNSTTGAFTYTGPSASEVRAHFTAGNGIDITNGEITSLITQYTNNDARNAISVVDNGGDGSLTYNGGVITYTGPSASEVRSHFTGGTGITITDGVVATTITQYTNSDARNSISSVDNGGDGSFSYDSATGVMTYTGPSATEVRAHFSAGTGITLTNGQIATTITQYTNTDARNAISVTDTGGDGSLSYDSNTGVFTYTGPSASEVRAHLSAGTGLTYANGQFAVDSTIATKTYADNAATTAVAAVIDAAPGTLDTLNELAAALGDDPNFATTITNSIATKLNSADFNSTFDARLATKSTTDIAEGNKLFYTDTRFDNRLATKTTDNLTEGTNNKYYATSLANADFDTRLATKTTDNLAQGSTNKYYATTLFNTDFATKEAQDLAFDNTISGLTATNTEQAINELQQIKVNVADLTAAVNLYPTTASSGINGYNLMVDTVADPAYNTTAVNQATGSITGSNQLIGVYTSAPNILVGNPGYITITTTGNIRKTSGNDSSFAFFYFKVYHRDGNGTETLLGTSNNTQEVNDANYAQYAASATLNAVSNFDDAGDRLVVKWYATKSGPNNPNFDILLGGNTPTRIVVPVPINVIPLDQTAAEVPVDTTNFAGLLSAADGNVQHALDTIDNIVLFSGNYNDLTNKPTIPSTTTDITEGNNLYFTQTRARESVSAVDNGGDGSFSYSSATGAFTYTGPGTTDYRAAFTAGTNIGIVDGVISVTGSLYTDSDAREAISVSDTGGDGSLSYNNTTGVITYAGPTTSDYRAAFSAGTGITLTDGVIATTITQYTDTLARSAVSAIDNGGDGSFSYNSSTGEFTYTGPSASEVRAHFSAGTGISLTNGQISSTITQYTDTNTRSAISAVDNGGDGSFTYDSNTGAFSYTGPSASEVRAHFSAGTGITLTNGQIATTITQYTNADAQGAISVVDNGGDGSLTYNAGVITYTGPSASEVRAHFSAGTGISLTNGSIAVDSTIATKTYADNAATTAVANVIDAAPSTLDTLNELAAALGDDPNFATTITTSLGNKLNTADFTSTADTWLGTKSTTNLTEGTNQYFTQARARNSLSAGTGISYNSTTGVISSTITQYTDTNARAAISVTDSGGDGSLSYDNATGVLTYTGPSASEVRAHFSAGTGITITNGQIATTITQYADSNARQAISVTDSGGDGSLSYNNSTGVITYTGPGVSDYRAAFSAGTGITITDGVIASTITDTNTTYSISAETTTGGANLRLTGSNAVLDEVMFASGSNITITRTDANTITIAGSAAGLTAVAQDTAPSLGGDLVVNGYNIVSVSNGNIDLFPNGTGKVVVGSGSAEAFISSNGANNLTLQTNVGSSGATAGYITIPSGGNNNLLLVPAGTGRVSVGGGVGAGTITSNGSTNLVLQTNNGTNSGTLTLNQGTNGNIRITPNGTGKTIIDNLVYEESPIYNIGTMVSGNSNFSPDFLNGNTQEITCQVRPTFTGFTNAQDGQTITVVVKLQSTYSATSILTGQGATVRWAGGDSALSNNANAWDVVTFYCVSASAMLYLGSINKGFI